MILSGKAAENAYSRLVEPLERVDLLEERAQVLRLLLSKPMIGHD